MPARTRDSRLPRATDPIEAAKRKELLRRKSELYDEIDRVNAELPGTGGFAAATQFVTPVVRVDGKPVGNGAPGLIASALRRDYHDHAEIA